MSVVVITGANGGIGLAAVRAFARRGNTVIAAARKPEQAGALQDLANDPDSNVHLQALEITATDRFARFVEQVVQHHGRIDVLVNNAGMHRAGALEDVDEAILHKVMAVNCLGPLLLSKAVLPVMRNQRSGLIIMMSSLSGIAGLPGDVPYTASKFALEGAAEALRLEVARWGIRVALVQGGLYATGIMDANLPPDAQLPHHYPAQSPYRPLVAWQLAQLRQRLPEAFDPAGVAELFVEIAQGESSQLRWPADEVAQRVLDTMLGQTDAERRAFLEQVAEVDWWLQGHSEPGAQPEAGAP